MTGIVWNYQCIVTLQSRPTLSPFYYCSEIFYKHCTPSAGVRFSQQQSLGFLLLLEHWLKELSQKKEVKKLKPLRKKMEKERGA